MDNRTEAREFLMSRRAKLSPERAGLSISGYRRVAGLRRTAVAMLADVSPEYYAKIERGNLAGVSDAVLEAVARALQLDDAEREHLFDLARVAGGAAQPVRKRMPKTWVARESLTRALDVIDHGPAFVRNGRMDVLATNAATNALGRAFHDEVFDRPGQGNRVPHPVGRPQRTPPRFRHQEFPPPRRRRDHPDLRGHGADRRTQGDETMRQLPQTPTSKNPPEQFTGDVWVDPIAAPQEPGQRMIVARVRFAPGARTAWHSHANGQTLHITDGVALIGTRDGTVIRATPGQTVYTPPREEHWHGAAPDRFMEHLAMLENAEDPATTTTWLEQVTDDDYSRSHTTTPEA